jgi:tRNA-dihydrouridine synthase A
MLDNKDKFAIAPMMDWTDRHCRVFHRLLTARALLYSEMVTSAAVVHGDRERLLGRARGEGDVALQLGGSDPRQLAEAARIGEGFGYVAINLNCGCPSDRVQSGRFGACLMAEPDLVADCVAAMAAAATVPVTVKCRIGIDDQAPEEALPRLIDAVRAAGAAHVIVHARKAWLEGLSPKENRSVPPLDYALVHRMKRERPDYPLSINGGIADLDAAIGHLDVMDGVMIGRAAYETPRRLAAVDRRVFGAATADPDPFEVVERLVPYAASVVERGYKLANVTRHVLGLFAGWPGAKAWRRILTVEGSREGAGVEVIRAALAQVRRPEAEAGRLDAETLRPAAE